jgi:hypothetical protein
MDGRERPRRSPKDYFEMASSAFDPDNGFEVFLMTVCSLAGLFALLNAFTPIALTDRRRLWLSIWTTVVLVVLGLDHLLRVWSMGPVEQAEHTLDTAGILLAWFLLGVSGLYLVENMFLLFGFLPSRGRFFNKAYFKELRELRRRHAGRYSDEQVPLPMSMAALVVSVAVFSANMHFGWVPAHVAIWSVLVGFPALLAVAEGRRG